MKKLALIALLFFCPCAWSACSVASIYITGAGQYSLSSAAPTVTITGPGTGATAGVSMTPYFPFGMTQPPTYLYVSGAMIVTGGSYTGPVSVTFTGGTYTTPATGFAIMSGSCGSGGGGGRNKFAWLM